MTSPTPWPAYLANSCYAAAPWWKRVKRDEDADRQARIEAHRATWATGRARPSPELAAEIEADYVAWAAAGE